MRFGTAAVLGVALAITGGTATAAARPGDGTIELPSGFAAEGIAIGAGNTFYAGSRAGGFVAIGDLRHRTSSLFVDQPIVNVAVGLKADLRRGLLWVAGGGTGQAAVYDLATADAIEAITLTAGPSFINDVVVTRDGAYFTNSAAPELYFVPADNGTIGEPVTIPLAGRGPAGDFVSGTNLNGIAATPNGKTLIVVNSAKGELYTVDPATGASSRIDLRGETVRTGDGILLSGPTLYVLQNGVNAVSPNQITVVRLLAGLSRAIVVDTLTSPLFETATTLAKRGNVLAAVNAQFAGAPIDPEPEVVLLRAR